MKTFFLFSALSLSTVITAQESPGEVQVALPQQAAFTDTVYGEAEAVEEEAAPTSTDLEMFSMEIDYVLWSLEDGQLSKEEARAKMDSIISELYLASASFFENYVPDTAEEVLSWNDDFSAAYSGPDSAQYPQEHYDTTFEEIDFDFSSFFEETPKTKVGVFGLHFGPNALVLNDRSMASSMDNINAGLSWESRIFFGQKRRIGGVKSPVQLETGLGIGSSVFSFKNGMTIDKDPMMFGAANLVPISGLSNVRRSNWSISSFDVPAILHLDFSPKGTFNEGLNIGFGVMGRVRYLSQASYNGADMNGDFYTEVRTNGFHTRLLNYALVGQLGYKKLKVTGKLEQLPLFKDNYFPEEAYLGSITVGYSLN
jgi:hypothetical protein